MLQALLWDLRFGSRTFIKAPGFTIVAVLTLALGIGAFTGMFSVVNGVLLRPLPFKDPDGLVLIKETIPRISPEPAWIPAPDVIDFEQRTSVFDGVGGFVGTQMDLTGTGSPSRIDLARLTWNTFPILGIPPVLGRTFNESEDHPGSYVAVLSYTCWQQRFGGSPDVLSQTIELDRTPYSIIGVMPPGFTMPLETAYPTPPELWVPMGFTDTERAAHGSLFIYGAVARLKPGITLSQAQADAASVMPYITELYPSTVRSRLQTASAVVPLAKDTYRSLRDPMYILLAAVGFILLIAIANIANLMLARGSDRQKELAIRIALGAASRRLVAQLLTESVLLAMIGGVVGVALAYFSTKVLLSELPSSLAHLKATSLDVRVLLLAIAAAVFSGLLFGAAPAFFALRTNLSSNLKEGGRSGSFGKQHQRLRALFVIVQVALALMLLVGSGLLIRSFQQVMAVKGGFRPEYVSVGSVFLSTAGYAHSQQVQNFWTELLARASQIPGAQSAALSTDVPLVGGWQRMITPEGYNPPPGAGLNPGLFTVVQGDYFQTMGIPLIEGRLFSPEDSINGSQAAIISESLAARYFAGEDPVGRRLKSMSQQKEASWLNIVGVVGDVKQLELEEVSIPHVYAAMTADQIPLLQRIGGVSAKLSIRTGGDPTAIAPALQSAVWSLDRQLPVTNLMTMDQVVASSTAPRRFTMILVISFAGAALLLASIGLYGVIAYSVTQRSHEIGIRVALGARRTDILRIVLGWGMALTLVGMTVGMVGAIALTKLIANVLFGVRALDAITFASVAIVLGSVALIACYIPARRAAKVDPIIALRAE
jgi:predicted permease